MNLFKLIQHRSRSFYGFVCGLSIVKALLYSGLLLFINFTLRSVNERAADNGNWKYYALLLMFSFLVAKIFQRYLVRLTNDMIYETELSMLEKFRYSTFETFEKIGADRIYSSIADVRILGQVPEVFITCVNSIAIIICGLGYLFWLSVIGGFIILSLMTILLVVYLYRNRGIERELNIVRDLQNHYYRFLRDLLSGFKEIKINSKRIDSIYDQYLIENRSRSRALGIATATKYVNNELIGNYSWYVVLGVILYGLPMIYENSSLLVASFIITIMYLMAPVANLIMFLPVFTRAKIVLQRIEKLQADISHQSRCDVTSNADSDMTEWGAFQQLKFNEVTFNYTETQERGNSFAVGPLSFTINRGEIIFVTGGNGSGKTTFVNILTGLYRSNGGDIFFNQQRILDSNYARYSDLFSVVFANHYLLSENYAALDLSRSNTRLIQLLEMMKLSDVVSWQADRLVLKDKFSKGQQKRLALVLTLLEDKPVVVLDEWAAEQDPAFRAFFYNDIIADLRRRKITLIAITHDDSYFHVANRWIKFEYGKIVYDGCVTPDAELIHKY